MAKRAPRKTVRLGPGNKRRSIIDVCVKKHGVHKGAVTAAWVVQYAVATLELEHVPSNREYAEYWAIDERNGWAHRARIKDVFGDKWPEVVQALAAEIEQLHTRSMSKLRSLPLPQT